MCLKIKSGGREGSDRSGRGLPTASDFKEILGNIRVLSVCVSAFAMFLLFSSIRGTMIPLYGATVLGLNSSEIGLIFSCTSLVIFIVLAFATQRLEEAFGRAGLLTISLVVCSLSVAAMSLPSDFATFIITSIPLGVGLGLLQPTPFAMIIDLSKPANRGLMMGVMRTVADIGVIVGPIIVGSLMNIGQPLLVFYVIAAIIGALSLMTWIVFRRPAERNGV
jgi:MFS family permease